MSRGEREWPLERVARFGQPCPPIPPKVSPLPRVWSDFQGQAEGSVPLALINEGAEMNVRKAAPFPGDTGDPLEKTFALFPPLGAGKVRPFGFLR